MKTCDSGEDRTINCPDCHRPNPVEPDLLRRPGIAPPCCTRAGPPAPPVAPPSRSTPVSAPIAATPPDTAANRRGSPTGESGPAGWEDDGREGQASQRPDGMNRPAFRCVVGTSHTGPLRSRLLVLPQPGPNGGLLHSARLPASGSSRWSRPMRAAKPNRAIRLAESGLAPFRQRLIRRMSMQSSRAKPRQENPAASLNLTNRWGNSSGNRAVPAGRPTAGVPTALLPPPGGDRQVTAHENIHSARHLFGQRRQGQHGPAAGSAPFLRQRSICR